MQTFYQNIKKSNASIGWGLEMNFWILSLYLCDRKSSKILYACIWNTILFKWTARIIHFIQLHVNKPILFCDYLYHGYFKKKIDYVIVNLFKVSFYDSLDPILKCILMNIKIYAFMTSTRHFLFKNWIVHDFLHFSMIILGDQIITIFPWLSLVFEL